MPKDRVREFVDLELLTGRCGLPFDADPFLNALAADDFDRFDTLRRRVVIAIGKHVFPAFKAQVLAANAAAMQQLNQQSEDL